jgi:hypothetical protein
MNTNRAVTATFVEDTAPPGGGTVTPAQTHTGTAEGQASVSTATPVVASADELYVVSVSTKPARAVTDVSGLGLTWTRVVAQCAGRNQTGVELWVGSGEATTDGTVTATLDGTPNAVVAVSSYLGADLSDPLGAVASTNTTGDPGDCSSGVDGADYTIDVPTTASDSLVHTAVALRLRSHTPGPDSTEEVEVVAGSGGSAAGVAVTTTAATSPTTSISGSLSGSSDWAVVAVAIRAAAA